MHLSQWKFCITQDVRIPKHLQSASCHFVPCVWLNRGIGKLFASWCSQSSWHFHSLLHRSHFCCGGSYEKKLKQSVNISIKKGLRKLLLLSKPTFRDCLQISLIILTKFRQLNYFKGRNFRGEKLSRISRCAKFSRFRKDFFCE